VFPARVLHVQAKFSTVFLNADTIASVYSESFEH